MKTQLGLAIIGAALISLPVAAQTTVPADPAPRAAQTAAAAGSLYEMKAGQWRATKLTGVNVYNNNNEKIGDVNELIVSRDGKVEAVVIGVGGFLGMGEHLAAVPFNQIKWMDGPREATVGARTTTTTTGSGTSTPPAGSATTKTERPATTTITSGDRPATTVNTERPATITTTERPAATTTTTADRSTMRDAYRGYPDHAVVGLTKEQLKALPEVRYAR
jgi:sporulation protein YlmC with PRC-barrel domain